MSGKLAFTMTNDTITVVVDGKPHVTPASSRTFKELQIALINQNWARAKEIASPAKFVLSWARPELGWSFDLDTGAVSYQGKELPAKLHERMWNMAQNKLDPQCWAKFWERVQANPSHRSVTQLFDFMAHAGIPITRTGMIMAYKSVRPDFLDHHSGTIDNSVGKVITMPRNQISDDPRTPCHEGLHVGAYAYASSFGSEDRIILLCEVDPADVVCVPYDASSQKVRCCKYRVVKVMGPNDGLMSDVFYGGDVPNAAPLTKLTGHEGMGSCLGDDDPLFGDLGLDDEDMDIDEDDDDDGDDDDEDCDDEDCDDDEEDSNDERLHLQNSSLAELRKIAGPNYGIKNASKIPGGRNALLAAILATLP